MRHPRLDWRVVGALGAWAALLTVAGQSGLVLTQATGRQTFLVQGWCEGVAGVLLLGWAVSRIQRVPSQRGWWALLLLVSVNRAGDLLKRPYVGEVLHAHAAKAAEQQMIWMAGALWLALLGALRWVPEETPRATVGATLAGIAGFCLLLGAEQMSVLLLEVPVLLLTVVQSVVMVWTWSHARTVFAGSPVTVVAGCGLLISAAMNGLIGSAVPSPSAVMPGWSWLAVWLPFTVTIVATGAAGVLWFWLLQRMELAAFATQLLALWLIDLLWQVAVFGFLSWRVDAALALGLGAITIALRARPQDEEPVRLGLV